MRAHSFALAILLVGNTWIATAEEPAKDAKVSAGTNLSTNAAPRMEISVKREGGPGLIGTTRIYLAAGADRFAFLVPESFGIDTSVADKVAVWQEGVCIINVRFLEAGAAEQKPDQIKAASRERILREHLQTKFVEEFSLGAANHVGPAFNISFMSPVGLPRSGCIAYIPLKTGVVEFSLESSPEKFDQVLTHFHYVLQTFRASDESGKLEATPISDRL